jgi:hypothetical protein
VLCSYWPGSYDAIRVQGSERATPPAEKMLSRVLTVSECYSASNVFTVLLNLN